MNLNQYVILNGLVIMYNKKELFKDLILIMFLIGVGLLITYNFK